MATDKNKFEMPENDRQYWKNAGWLYGGYILIFVFLIFSANTGLFKQTAYDIKNAIILIGCVCTLYVIHRIGVYFSKR